MQTTIETIPVECPDCHWSGKVDAEIVDETAFWVCPSTWCERNLDDPAKMTDWWVESSECDVDRQGDR
jgi:hypothetical protein